MYWLVLFGYQPFSCIICCRKHTVIVYSPMASDQPVRPELADQERLLQYLYPRAQMNESVNPRAFAIYMDTSVPVSITVDGLQPNTEYLIFVHVEMLHQVGLLYVYMYHPHVCR